jgi:FkbM family methyltransferase
VRLFNPNFNDPTFRYCNGGAYGNFYSEYLSKLKKKKFQYIDIGANIGIYSLIASRNDNCTKIDAFEPNPLIYNNLKKNLSLINHANSYNVAITNQSGEIKFYVDPKSSGSSQIDNSNSNLKIKAVDRDFIKKITIKDLSINIKIDVEGHEFVVLEEIVNSIDLKMINSIYIEIANNDKIINDYIQKLRQFKLIHFKETKKRCDCLFEKIV